MRVVQYTREKLLAVLAQIEILSFSDFPYEQSKDALSILKGRFGQSKAQLDNVSENYEEDIIRQFCAEAREYIYDLFPLLGFILRSTNVRNAFELHAPLLDFVHLLFSKKTNLVLSSEWDFGPFTYPPLQPLPDFVLIGLPASETDNPLIVPVAGHELGHHVWDDRKLITELSPLIQSEFMKLAKEKIDYLRHHEKLLHELKNAEAPQALVKLKECAQKQCEELFCDFVGLRIFGESFLHTYHYLLGPIVENYHYPNHPPDKTRAEALKSAEKTFFNEGLPPEFLQDFSPTELQYDETNISEEHLAFELTCEVAKRQIPYLLERSMKIVDDAGIPKPDPKEAERVKESFEHLAPAIACKNLADIINAGWKAHLDPNLWNEVDSIDNRKHAVLNDLVLKTIEVMEFEKKTD